MGREATLYKAQSLPALSKLAYKQGKGDDFHISLDIVAGYKYPALQQDFYFYNVGVDFNFLTRIVSGYEADKIATPIFFKDTAIGYKIDGGPITPFFYNGKFTPFTYPEGTKTLEFFTKTGSASTRSVQMFGVDLVNNTISVSNSYSFPVN